MCSQCRLPQQTKREGSGETAPWEGSGETAPREGSGETAPKEGSGETAPTSNPSNNGVGRLAPSRRRKLLGQCHDPTHRSPCAGVATLSRRRKLLGPSCTHPSGTSPKGAEVVTLARRRKLLGPSHTHLRGRGTPRLLTRLAPSTSRTPPSLSGWGPNPSSCSTLRPLETGPANPSTNRDLASSRPRNKASLQRHMINIHKSLRSQHGSK